MSKLRTLVRIGYVSMLMIYADYPMQESLMDPIIQLDLPFTRKGCAADYGACSLDNIRGVGNIKAYDCQDRACAITIKPIVEQFPSMAVMMSNMKSGKMPQLHVTPGVFLIGVFDGHGNQGDDIASLTRFFVCDYFKKFYEQSYTKLLYHDFLIVGNTIQSQLESNIRAQQSGTTACFCLLEGPLEGYASNNSPITLYPTVFCNVGDSRTIVISDNEIVFSTSDHKPTTSHEKARIEQVGGYVENGYAYGPNNGVGFSLSRSWGDCVAHRNGVLLHTPEVYSFGVPTQPSNALLKIKEEARYLLEGDIIVSATDGLWDVFTNEEVAQYICKRKQQGADCETISEELAHKARDGNNNANEISRDDITVLIVELGMRK